MTRLTLPDGSLHYSREGAGAAVILLHSLGGAGPMWHTSIATLASRFDVISPDARGHGLSSDEGEISVEGYAADVLALVRHLGLSYLCLVGLSMGAQAALRVAAELGPRVYKLVLASTHLGAGGVGANRRLFETRARIAELGPAAFARDYTFSRTLPTTDRAVLDAFAVQVERTLPHTYPVLQHSIACQSLASMAKQVTARTLVLVGDQDVSTPPARAREVASAVPSADLVVVPDANHLANLDNPAVFDAELSRFL